MENSLILASVPFSIVKSHGRWSSESYQRYFDAVHQQEARLAA